jgi:hypothetical protein
MKPPIPPPTINSRLHGFTDVVFCLFASILGVCATTWMLPILRNEEPFSAGWWFLAAIVGLFGILIFGGLAAPFYRIHVSESEISYGLFRLRRIKWASIIEYRYLGLVPNMGFTERAFFRTENGKTYIVPIAHDSLRGYFNGMQNYKK